MPVILRKRWFLIQCAYTVVWMAISLAYGPLGQLWGTLGFGLLMGGLITLSETRPSIRRWLKADYR